MKRFTTCRVVLAAMAAMVMTACHNESNYKFDAQYVQDKAKNDFYEYFKKSFGDIDPRTTWDFAGEPLSGIANEETRSTRTSTTNQVTWTYDLGYPFVNAEGWFEIPSNMQASLNKVKENEDNSKMGCTYAMSVPENSFAIIPLRQGYTTHPYELHMVVGSGDKATDYLLWKKGEMLQTRPAGSTQAWTKVTTANNSYTYGNYDVRARVLTFKDMPKDEPMYFYLYRPSKKWYPSSLDGFMKDFTPIVELPEQIVAAGKKVKVIGAEGKMVDSDFDYEDVMFMIVGDPTLPDEIKPLDKLKFTQTISKRYMIEDLGTSDDTDFNDIVVDVNTTRTITFEYNSQTGQITNRKYGAWDDQTAIIRHLGGYLPFQLTIGNTLLPKIDGELGSNPNTLFTVEGWDPATNNISVIVKQVGNDWGVNSITFPTTGSVPLIISTSVQQPWMTERYSIIPTLKELIGYQNLEE